MKRLLLVLACAFVLAALEPAPASAHWWWPHHSKTGASHKDKTKKSRRERRHNANTDPLYSVPKTVGWWHRGPGPAGAGAK